jgi:hypothetical protein
MPCFLGCKKRTSREAAKKGQPDQIGPASGTPLTFQKIGKLMMG